MVFDRDVLALDIAGLTQSPPERLDEMLAVGEFLTVKKSDQWHPLNLLRVRHQRPNDCRAAEQRYEFAPPHSITSSASCCKRKGTSTPNALAVFILITRSNLLGCIIGRSAGFSPLRTRPT